MPNILLLATAWGPKHGGINAFNMDFAAALAAYLKPSGRVFCAVLDGSREDAERAQALGVTLVPIEKDANLSSYDEAWAYTVLEKLPPETSIDWWVGHDVISASAAVKGPRMAGSGGSAVIMHMNYADYASYKHGSGAEAVRKERRQRDLFRQADKHFAIGPLLRDALRDAVDGEVTMLVPGFAEVPIRPAEHRLTAITFGRMDREAIGSSRAGWRWRDSRALFDQLISPVCPRFCARTHRCGSLASAQRKERKKRGCADSRTTKPAVKST